MAISDQVRGTGELADFHGRMVRVGVDHDCVTLGDFVFTREQVQHLQSKLWFAAQVSRKQSGQPCHGPCCFGVGEGGL